MKSFCILEAINILILTSNKEGGMGERGREEREKGERERERKKRGREGEHSLGKKKT